MDTEELYIYTKIATYTFIVFLIGLTAYILLN